MAKRWKREHITYLKRYAGKRTTAELAKRFRTKADVVTDKLGELGLASKDSVAEIRLEHDPLVQVYTRGTRALYAKKWREAKELFEKVVEKADQVELRSGALRYLEVADRNLPGRTKAVDDPFLLAVYERNRGNLEEALELCIRGGRQSKDERFAYLAAAIHSLSGNNEKAAELLSRAIDLEPKNRVHAVYDSDFVGLREDTEYVHLFESE